MRSGAGLGIRRHEPGKNSFTNRGVYYQEFIDGESCSAVFLASGDRCRLLGATDQQFGVPDLPEEPFLYMGSSGPRRVNRAEGEQLSRLGESLTRRFGLQGLFNVDYVYRDSSVWPLEVNPMVATLDV